MLKLPVDIHLAAVLALTSNSVTASPTLTLSAAWESPCSPWLYWQSEKSGKGDSRRWIAPFGNDGSRQLHGCGGLWCWLVVKGPLSHSSPSAGQGKKVRVNCSSTGSPQASVPARPPAPTWAPLYGLQFSLGVCCCVGCPLAAASCSFHLLWHGLLQRLQHE